MGTSTSGRRPWVTIDLRRVSDLAFLGRTYREIGRELGRDKTTIWRHCWQLVEARRADRDEALKRVLTESSLRS
jgi:hypothetical protein